MSSCGQFSGAGVLLIECPANQEDEFHFILFREGDQTYTEPGGMCEPEKHGSHIADTACAELFEETAGLFDISAPLLAQQPFQQHKHRGQLYRAYVWYVWPPVDEADYHHNLQLLRHHNAPEYMMETDHLTRVSLSETLRAIQKMKKKKKEDAAVCVMDHVGRYIQLRKRTVQLLCNVFAYDSMDWLYETLGDIRRYRKKEIKPHGYRRYVWDHRH